MAKNKEHKHKNSNWFYAGLELTEDDVRRSMAATQSCKEAAAYLDISYPSWRKYATAYRDQETGKTLFELHKNKSMKGVVGRSWVGGKHRVNWEAILVPNQRVNPERLTKLKAQLLEYDKLEEKCYRCEFEEERIEDHKKPLLLNFKNGDKSNWKIQNIELVCYNCAFLHCLDFYEDDVVRKVETLAINAIPGKQARKQFYQLDDFYIDHLNKLGLHTNTGELQDQLSPKIKEEDTGNEFVDFV
jgi:hypothetical protein